MRSNHTPDERRRGDGVHSPSQDGTGRARSERRAHDQRRSEAERQQMFLGDRNSITDVPLTGVVVAVVATVMLVLFLAWFFGEPSTGTLQNIGASLRPS